MAIKKYSPTSSSRRHMTVEDYSILSNVKPEKSLLKKLKYYAGRNSSGRITTRHKGGANKRLYRLVDFRRDKFDIPAKVETLEYDPYRTAFIAKVLYKDGERRYILAPSEIKEGDEIITSVKAPIKIGNRMKLKNIPVGSQVYNIELNPGKGGQLARSAGAYAEVRSNDSKYTELKLSSKEIRKVNWECYASIGQVSNKEHNLIVFGKAGKSRWLGIRPTVRGSAMNPVDHPYGGGEGKAKRGTKRPKTKWGKVTGGRKTRKPKKWSNKLIIKRRK